VFVLIFRVEFPVFDHKGIELVINVSEGKKYKYDKEFAEFGCQIDIRCELYISTDEIL
jgi:hypothetical protein